MDSLEREIEKKLYGFDLHALLALLRHRGYGEDEILFRSNISASSPDTLVEKIEFRDRPIRQVVLTLNMGLLSTQSPLPSYFIKAIERENLDEKAFVDFLEFFNHKILQSYLSSIYPEGDPHLFSDWGNVKRGYLRLLGLNSTTCLHHIFQLTYPELGVLVEKSPHQRHLQTEPFRLGQTILGGTPVLGGRAVVHVPGFDVTLYCDEESDETGASWPQEALRRLQNIVFPVLKEVEIHIRVILVIRSQKGWLRLQGQGYLGIDRVKGGEKKNRVVVVFHGHSENFSMPSRP